MCQTLNKIRIDCHQLIHSFIEGEHIAVENLLHKPGKMDAVLYRLRKEMYISHGLSLSFSASYPQIKFRVDGMVVGDLTGFFCIVQHLKLSLQSLRRQRYLLIMSGKNALSFYHICL